jgi:hypothetical protein
MKKLIPLLVLLCVINGLYAQTTAYAGPDELVCKSSGSYTVYSSSASNYTSLMWVTTGTGSFSYGGGSLLIPTYTFGPDESGTVILILTAIGPSGYAKDSMNLTIQTSPMASAGPDSIITNTQIYPISGASVANAASVLWACIPAEAGTLNNNTIINPVFTPAIGFTGAVSLILTETAYLPCANVTDMAVLIVQNSGNNAPEVEDVTAATPEDTPIDICMTITDPDTGSVFSTFVYNGPFHGTMSQPLMNGNEMCFTYSPNLNYNGPETFFMLICDNGTPLLCDSVNISITVLPVNDPPQVNDDFTVTSANSTVAIPILDNDSDIDGSLVTSSIDLDLTTNGVQTSYAVASQGLFQVSPVTGMAWFTPDPGFVGNVTPVSYRVCDNGTPLPGQCGEATINVNVLQGPVVYAGVDTSIAYNQVYLINSSSAYNYLTLFWTSSGTGTFDNASILHPTYTPGASDIANGFVVLMLTADSAGIESSDSMVLIIIPEQAPLICSNVTAGGNTWQSAYSTLFYKPDCGPFILKDSVTSVLNQDFCFIQCPSGNYIFYAEPEFSLWNSFIPTYYGNVADWEEATVVNPGGGGAIDLLPVTNSGIGADSIYGNISIEGDNYSASGNAAGIVVLLYNSNNEPLKWTKTDNNGFYSFPLLPDGGYTVKPTITGYTTNARAVTLSGSSPTSIVNFVIEGNLITSLHNEESFISSLYPNPAADNIIVTITPDAPRIGNYKILDIRGKILIEQKSVNVNSRMIKINTAKLCNGSYFLKMQYINRSVSSKRFEILR